MPIARGRRADHRKTRTGCAGCKQRKVKCGEEKPSCANCKRNFLECSLTFLIPLKPKIATGPRGPNMKNLSTVHHTTLDLGLKSLSLDTKSSELLHHYTSCASLEFGQTSNNDIWQVEIPRMALSHEFLMNGILAISALHMSTLQTHRKRELIQSAIALEGQALPKFRQMLSSRNKKHTNAVFVFSGFIIPYMLAVSRSFGTLDGIPTSDQNHPHWFHSLRGVMALLAKTSGELAQGPFRPWLKQSEPVNSCDNPDDIHFARVHEMLQSTPYSDEEELNSCRQALNELRRIAALPHSACGTINRVGATYIWPGAISESYMQLLHKKRPEALVVLAHYCVLLKAANSCWYFEGVGKNMLEAVNESLSKEWKPWIEWALRQPEL